MPCPPEDISRCWKVSWPWWHQCCSRGARRLGAGWHATGPPAHVWLTLFPKSRSAGPLSPLPTAPPARSGKRAPLRGAPQRRLIEGSRVCVWSDRDSGRAGCLPTAPHQRPAADGAQAQGNPWVRNTWGAAPGPVSPHDPQTEPFTRPLVTCVSGAGGSKVCENFHRAPALLQGLRLPKPAAGPRQTSRVWGLMRNPNTLLPRHCRPDNHSSLAIPLAPSLRFGPDRIYAAPGDNGQLAEKSQQPAALTREGAGGSRAKAERWGPAQPREMERER